MGSDDALADFNPTEALERIRELVKPWTEMAELLELQELVAALDDCIVRSAGTRLPSTWRTEKVMRGGTVSNPDIQYFAVSGTWVKPEGAVRVDVVIAGGDGGNRDFHIDGAGREWCRDSDGLCWLKFAPDGLWHQQDKPEGGKK